MNPAEMAKTKRGCVSGKHFKRLGIKCLLTEDEIQKIWDRDGGEKMDFPCLDRIDPFGNYSFQNCRFIERVHNSKRGRMFQVVNYRGRVCGESDPTVSVRISLPVLMSVKKLAKTEGRSIRVQMEMLIKTAFNLKADQALGIARKP